MRERWCCRRSSSLKARRGRSFRKKTRAAEGASEMMKILTSNSVRRSSLQQDGSFSDHAEFRCHETVHSSGEDVGISRVKQ